jgi:CheY-like chemotaxis protein
MKATSILWADDEMDLLRPHIIFLQSKGFNVVTCFNGNDAIDVFKKEHFDIVFLDENMPGLSGIETLEIIKNIDETVPVVLITKSEEENIMDKAIGAKISDYLIKPVNPNQIILTIKKNLQNRELITKKVVTDYQQEFMVITSNIATADSYDDWINIYRKLVHWESSFENTDTEGLDQLIKDQFSEANNQFIKYIKSNYLGWFDDKKTNKPVHSPLVIKEKILPLLATNKNIVFILIDNLRFDQWKTISKNIIPYYKIQKEDAYFSILPTVTQYARNALFSGLMPLEIRDLYPDIWSDEDEEGLKNLYEQQLLQKQLLRLGYNQKFFFTKVLSYKDGEKLAANYSDILNYNFSVIIYNFIDMLSHARTDREMIRELAGTQAAYRSLTQSWFEHSTLFELLKKLSKHDVTVIITTDHGSIQVTNPVKVIGDKETSTNLRYKTGKSLNYNHKEVFEIADPLKAHLPSLNISSKFIFALAHDYFVYPNNYNYYVNYYKNTFQHGGISMEEMIVPLIFLEPL